MAVLFQTPVHDRRLAMRDRTPVVHNRDLAAYARGLVVRDQVPEVLGYDCSCCDLDHEWIDQILGVVLSQHRRTDGDRNS